MTIRIPVHSRGRLSPDEIIEQSTLWSAHTDHKNWPLRTIIMLLILGSASALILTPLYFIEILFYLISACIIIVSMFRLASLFCADINAAKKTLTTLRATPTPLENWPRYTVLVPIFKEAHMVRGLMDALDQVEYPRENLEILMITEQADHKTVQAVNSNLRAPFKHIIIPYSLPQTKPKALNIAMNYASGEFITIYDAEDRPHPKQLKAAIYAFKDNPKLGAVQAPLEYFNSDQNWLTRQFSLEYSALFHVWNPFLARIGVPFPLGGTSNHLRRTALDQIDLWDSYNVTEDADLTFRLAAFDWKIGTISPPTQEEAVSAYSNWQHQRERWLKGYLQTWQVHMRAVRGFGWRRILALQLTLGFTIVSALLHLPATLLFGGLLLASEMSLVQFSPSPWYYCVFIMGYLSAILSGVLGAILAKKTKLLNSALAMPLYWLLLFLPATRSIHQLITAPYHWNKTEHGEATLGQLEYET